jgi:hypothetical protein
MRRVIRCWVVVNEAATLGHRANSACENLSNLLCVWSGDLTLENVILDLESLIFDAASHDVVLAFP